MIPATPLQAIRDAISRIVAAREEVEHGDTLAASSILADLEHDLACTIDRHAEGRWAA